MFDMYEIESIILGMADIVMENRRLRRELEEAKVYEEKYNKLLDQSVEHANKSTAMLLEAIMVGTFSNKKE